MVTSQVRPTYAQKRNSTAAVVTIVRGRREHLARQRDWLRHDAPDVSHVIVDMGGDPIDVGDCDMVIDFPVAPSGPLPLAAARNLGAQHAVGSAGADALIFLDVDCIPAPGLVEAYRSLVGSADHVWSGPVGYLPPSDSAAVARHLDAPGGLGPGGLDASTVALVDVGRFHDGRPRIGQGPAPAPPQMFWSLSFALAASTFAAVGGFDESYVGYGGEDTDFARSVQAAGIELWFDGGPLAFHQHHPVSSPPVEHVDDIVVNARRFHDKWGEWPMAGWLEDFAQLGLIDWNPSSTVIERLQSDHEIRG